MGWSPSGLPSSWLVEVCCQLYLLLIIVKAVSPEEMAAYRQTMQLRDTEAQQQLQNRFHQAWNVAKQASDLLKQNFQAAKVFVFGSLVHQNWFSNTSDIDLAVAGLSAWDHLAAVAQLQDLSAFKVDLIRLEACQPEFRSAIETEGQLI